VGMNKCDLGLGTDCDNRLSFDACFWCQRMTIMSTSGLLES